MNCKFCLSKVDSKKQRKVILLATVPVLGTLVLLSPFAGATFMLQRRKNNAVQDPSQKIEGAAFSIWNFDWKHTNEDIIQAIGLFDDKHCIGTGAYGTKKSCQMVGWLLSKRFNHWKLKTN